MFFSSPSVTLDILLQDYSSINRNATIQSQSIIVEFRKVFCFRKWLAKTSNLTIGQSNSPPAISHNTKQPDISTDDTLCSIAVLQATK